MTGGAIRPLANLLNRVVREARSTWAVWWTALFVQGVHWSGDNSIGAGCKFSIVGRSRLTVGNGTALADGARLFLRDGVLDIGSRAFIGYGTIIAAQEQIIIGDDVLIGEYVTIRDQDHVFAGLLATASSGFITAPIRIGDNVWLGAKVSVLKGVTIGNNVVVGANSVVTRDLPDNVLAAGVPARVIRRIDAAKSGA